MTLALFGQWAQFPSERAFYRYAEHHLRNAFPHLPNRSQFNRLQRTHREAITVFALCMVQMLRGQETAYEVLDSTEMPNAVGWAGWLVSRLVGRLPFVVLCNGARDHYRFWVWERKHA